MDGNELNRIAGEAEFAGQGDHPGQPQGGLANSRREQIMHGQAEPRLLMTKSPRLSGRLASLIARSEKRKFDHRCEQRYGTAAFQGPATLEVDGIPLSICDISASGIGVKGAFDPVIGQPVAIRIEGCHDLAGQIIWSNGEKMGLQLPDDAIRLASLD